MSELSQSSSAKRGTLLAAFATCLALPPSSHATLINFDDLRSGTPVTTQYADRGLVVVNGVIRGTQFVNRAPIVSPPNALYDLFGPGLTLQFVGTLPTTVSMFVTASLEDRIFITAWRDTEVLGSFLTDGFHGVEELSTPAIPRQPVTLTGPGISRVELGSFYDRRGDINIDDLSFSATPISEPPTALLAVLGLVLAGGLSLSKRRPGGSP